MPIDAYHEESKPSEENASNERTTVQSIARAAAILRALEGETEGLSLSEIAKIVSLSRSSVHRIATTMAKEGWIIAASPNGKMRLGPGLLQLANSVDYDLKAILRPFIAELARAVDETVDLAVARSGSAIFIDQISGRKRIIAVSAIGERFPLHCTANGKALLSCMSAADAKQALALSLKNHPDHPLKDETRLFAEIEEARTNLVAFDEEDNSVGVGAVGTALRDSSGTLFAISIPAPIQSYRCSKELLIERLLMQRARIEQKIGLPNRSSIPQAADMLLATRGDLD